MLPPLAVFVSPHGFGHAARASAVMAALADRVAAPFQLFATTPAWFFDEAVPGGYVQHRIEADVGFRQRDSLVFDLGATVAALDAMLPFEDALVDRCAGQVTAAGCGAVLCDIAPLGIAVAERAGLPSVLVENFTWPWLYEPLLDEAPGLARHADYLRAWFERATVHIQAHPACTDVEAIQVEPVSRAPRRTRRDIRATLEVPQDVPVVVITMGGVDQPLPFLPRLTGLEPVHFVVTGAPATAFEGNVRAFGRDERLYMPDLIEAADAVVAKLGYSTLAEVWASGRPLARVVRDDSREMGPLDAWARAHLPGFAIEGRAFGIGDWLDRLPELLAFPAGTRRGPGGAARVAEVVAGALRAQRERSI